MKTPNDSSKINTIIDLDYSLEDRNDIDSLINNFKANRYLNANFSGKPFTELQDFLLSTCCNNEWTIRPAVTSTKHSSLLYFIHLFNPNANAWHIVLLNCQKQIFTIDNAVLMQTEVAKIITCPADQINDLGKEFIEYFEKHEKHSL